MDKTLNAENTPPSSPSSNVCTSFSGVLEPPRERFEVLKSSASPPKAPSTPPEELPARLFSASRSSSPGSSSSPPLSSKCAWSVCRSQVFMRLTSLANSRAPRRRMRAATTSPPAASSTPRGRASASLPSASASPSASRAPGPTPAASRASRSRRSSLVSRAKLNANMASRTSRNRKWPTHIHAAKYSAAAGPAASIPRQAASCHWLAVSISKTATDAEKTSSKCFPNGRPPNGAAPPKMCMPRIAKTKTNTSATHARSRAAATSRTSFSENARALRLLLNTFAARSTRTSRNARSAPAPAPPPSAKSSSATPTRTITKSNLLKVSAKYSLSPRPASFTSSSAANAMTKTKLSDSRNAADAGDMPWCSNAIAAVFATTSDVVTASKCRCSTSARNGRWYDHRALRNASHDAKTVCPYVCAYGGAARFSPRVFPDATFGSELRVFSSSVLVRAYSATTMAVITRAAKHAPRSTVSAKKLLTNAPSPTAASICVAARAHPRLVSAWNTVKHPMPTSSKEVYPPFGFGENEVTPSRPATAADSIAPSPSRRHVSPSPHARPLGSARGSHGRLPSARTNPSDASASASAPLSFSNRVWKHLPVRSPANESTPTMPNTRNSHANSTSAQKTSGAASKTTDATTRTPGTPLSVRNGFSARNARTPVTFPPTPAMPSAVATKLITPATTTQKSSTNQGCFRYAPGPMTKLRATTWSAISARNTNVNTDSTMSRSRFHVASGSCVGSYIARVTQLVTITLSTNRSNHRQFSRRQTSRLNRERSWKTYRDVLFLSNSAHQPGMASRNLRRGPRRSLARRRAVASASARAISAAVARRTRGFEAAGRALTTGIVLGCRDGTLGTSALRLLLLGRRDAGSL